MSYEMEMIKSVFKMYLELMNKGQAPMETARAYQTDTKVRELMDNMAQVMDCEIFLADRKLYMIPKASDSIMSISNKELLTRYFPSKWTNQELYTMYFAIMVLMGEFYDSDISLRPTKEFIRVDAWIEQINLLLESLKGFGEEKLQELEKEYEYNWRMIIERWESLDTYREDATDKKRATSKYAFMTTVCSFLIDQDLIEDLGEDEVTLTEKAKVIVSRYYMDSEYNRELMSFIYGLKEQTHE